MPCAHTLSQFEKDPKLTMFLRTCLIDKPQVAQHTERHLKAQQTEEEPLNISLESSHIEVSLSPSRMMRGCIYTFFGPIDGGGQTSDALACLAVIFTETHCKAVKKHPYVSAVKITQTPILQCG